MSWGWIAIGIVIIVLLWIMCSGPPHDGPDEPPGGL